MKGLEVSEVRYSWIYENNYDFRIDSEYFAQKYAKTDNMLSYLNCKKLYQLSSKITDGTHFTPNYIDNGYKFFSAINVSDNYFDADAGFKYISEAEHKQLYSRCNPEPNDVIMRKVGVGIRKACVVPDLKDQFSIFVSVALIKCKSINPYYLSTFINSRYGQIQFLRFNKGIGQPDLHLEDISRCLVPILLQSFQLQIEQMVKSAHAKLEESKQLYAAAEDQLLSELGLKDWQPKNDNINVKTLKESFLSSGRLDAEYYQSKYDALFAQLSNYECNTLKQIVNINKSVEPGSDAYQDNGIPFVRVSDVDNFGISDPNIFLSPDNFDLQELRPKKDTILLSKDGSVGIAYKVEKDLDCITSGALLHLTVFNQDYNPDYLTLVLNSKIVKMQAERDANGAIIQHWKPSEIEQVIIPKLPKSIQNEISSKIQKSFALKTESKCLLEEAKKMVEQEIEKGGE